MPAEEREQEDLCALGLRSCSLLDSAGHCHCRELEDDYEKHEDLDSIKEEFEGKLVDERDSASIKTEHDPTDDTDNRMSMTSEESESVANSSIDITRVEVRERWQQLASSISEPFENVQSLDERLDAIHRAFVRSWKHRAKASPRSTGEKAVIDISQSNIFFRGEEVDLCMDGWPFGNPYKRIHHLSGVKELSVLMHVSARDVKQACKVQDALLYLLDECMSFGSTVQNLNISLDVTDCSLVNNAADDRRKCEDARFTRHHIAAFLIDPINALPTYSLSRPPSIEINYVGYQQCPSGSLESQLLSLLANATAPPPRYRALEKFTSLVNINGFELSLYQLVSVHHRGFHEGVEAAAHLFEIEEAMAEARIRGDIKMMRRERKRAFRVAKAFAEKVKGEVDRLQECQGKDDSGREPLLARAIDEGEGFLKDIGDALRKMASAELPDIDTSNLGYARVDELIKAKTRQLEGLWADLRKPY